MSKQNKNPQLANLPRTEVTLLDDAIRSEEEAQKQTTKKVAQTTEEHQRIAKAVAAQLDTDNRETNIESSLTRQPIATKQLSEIQKEPRIIEKLFNDFEDSSKAFSEQIPYTNNKDLIQRAKEVHQKVLELLEEREEQIEIEQAKKPENKQPNTEPKAFAFTVGQDLEVEEIAYARFSSKKLFEIAEKKRKEEVREKNKKLVETILAKKQEGVNYLAISAKKLPRELKEDFRPLLIGLDERTIDKIIDKGNISIVVELINCGSRRCLQGCNDDPPLASHPKVRIRVYNGKNLFIDPPENLDINKYIDTMQI